MVKIPSPSFFTPMDLAPGEDASKVKYEPMASKDSHFKKIYMDFAKGKDQTAVSIFKVIPKKRKWYWPFKSKKQKTLELMTQYLLDDQDFIDKANESFRNMYLYGNWDYKDDQK